MILYTNKPVCTRNSPASFLDEENEQETDKQFDIKETKLSLIAIRLH